MDFAINPVTPVGTSYYAANTTQVNGGYASYEQLLAVQELNDLDEIGSSGSGSGSSVDSALGTADLLDLSPAALNLLNGIEANNTTNLFGLSSLSGTSTVNIIETSSASGTSITTTDTINTNAANAQTTQALTPVQQAEVSSIVSEFATAPVTQQTFNQIESALTSAGINPAQVSLQQLLTGYEYSYTAGLPFNEQLFTDTLASELEPA